MTGYDRFRVALEQHPIALPESTPAPRSGQVWRASWDDTAMNIYVHDVDDSGVVAVPITADVDLIRSPRLFLEGEESPIGYDAVVWRGPRLQIPTFVLDGCYGSIPPVPEEPSEPDVELSEAARLADAGWRMQVQVEQALHHLSSGSWVPTTRAVGPIRDFLSRSDVKARDIIERLALHRNIVARLIDGSWWIDDETAERLAEMLGISMNNLPSQHPFEDDSDLLAVMDAPSRRSKLRKLANNANVPEARARLDVSLALLGARTRQTRRDIDAASMWNQLLDEYLDYGE